MGIYQTFSFWFLHFSLCGVVVFLQLQTLKRRDCNETGTVISLKKETDQGSWSNGSNNSSEINLDLSRTPVMNTSPVSSQNGKSLLPTTSSKHEAHCLQAKMKITITPHLKRN